jgi:hypothetical protein
VEVIRISTLARALAAIAAVGLAALATQPATAMAASTGTRPAPVTRASHGTGSPTSDCVQRTSRHVEEANGGSDKDSSDRDSSDRDSSGKGGSGKHGSGKDDADRDGSSEHGSGESSDKHSSKGGEKSSDTEGRHREEGQDTSKCPVVAPPAPVTPPAPSGVGAGRSTRPVAATAHVARVTTPATGAELPLGAGLALTGLGVGLLAAGRRPGRTVVRG